MILRGKVSWFGGPNDTGVAPDEGLAFIYKVEDAPHLFLPQQPPNTTGLARRLDPEEYYIACRWDYDMYPKPSLLEHTALVRSPKTGKQFIAHPADWGPHVDTGRVADISKGLMDALGIQTDDEVEVAYPANAIEPSIDINIPAWLEIARRCIGIEEEPGAANSPQIMRAPEIIAATYPEMEEYCSYYTGDDIAWCGLAVAFFTTSAGYRPVFGSDDVHRFLWAAAWSEWGDQLTVAKPGAIIVLDHHVALYERTEGSNVILLGGNQSDMVKESAFATSGIKAIRWPTGG